MIKIKNRVFPIVAIFIFATLAVAFLINQEALPQGQRLPVLLGLLAFSLALTDVFIASRPKKMEEKVGLPAMYSIHGAMGLVLILAVIAHAVNELTAKENVSAWALAAPAGLVSAVFLLLTALTGAFILSNTLIQKSASLRRLKDQFFKREMGLWTHRLSVPAILIIFVHMMAIEFVRSNTPLVLLSAFYVLMAAGGYITSKVAGHFLPPYVLKRSIHHNPSVYELEFEPRNGKLMSYKPGQYVFVCFIKSSLPKESHPFSISSAPLAERSSLSVMIKESGDYTRLIGGLKSGDIATLEGPYGNFLDDATSVADRPMVMLAGGIGVTPIFSILRSRIDQGALQDMVLVWSLSTEKDLFLLEELREMRRINRHFSYHITFSKDEVELFDHGQISQDYLRRVGIDQLYGKAHFFICGPPPMMDSMKAILKNNGVASGQIHIEEFSF